MKVVVGRIGSAYGVKGWVKLQSFTDPVDNIFGYHPWYVEDKGDWKPIDCDQYEFHNDKPIVHIQGYDTPERVKQLAGREIAIDKSLLPKLPEGEFYWHELIGLTAMTPQGVILGTTTQIVSNGAHPILMIVGEKTHLIPLLFGQFIGRVDLEKGQMVVKWDPEF